MGSEQARDYRYHLVGTYVDKLAKRAIGPQLQALRIAAANPASALLTLHPSPQNATLPCRSEKGGRDAVTSKPSLTAREACWFLNARDEVVVIVL